MRLFGSKPGAPAHGHADKLGGSGLCGVWTIRNHPTLHSSSESPGDAIFNTTTSVPS